MSSVPSNMPPAAPAISAGDTAWVLASTCLVFLMVPGLGYFYSGMARHHNALSLIFLSMIAVAIVSIEWWFWGYTLALSPTGGPFIGDFKNFALRGMAKAAAVHPNAATIPESVYVIYQGMFAVITPALAFGACAERIRILPAMVFLLLWSTLVYNIVCYWAWAPNGWAKTLGYLDYAGGGPVHIASGVAALVYARHLGKRHGLSKSPDFNPHSYSSVMLGTALLWFGWFGFNAGSALAANSRTGFTAIVTNLAGAVGGMTWLLIGYWRGDKKWSSFGFCCGAIAGLAAITPASGYVEAWAAFVIGALAGVICNYATDMKHHIGLDDALDVFAVHGIGGFLGVVLTGVFADSEIINLDGSTAPGGWVSGHFMQVPIQLAGAVAIAAWTFVLTNLILYAMNMLPTLRNRMDRDEEIAGTDLSQMGEYGYAFVGTMAAASSTNVGLKDKNEETLTSAAVIPITVTLSE